MESNWAEISLCSGFFLIYFIDEFIHYFFGEAIQHSHTHVESAETHRNVSQNNYGAISESEPLLSEQQAHKYVFFIVIRTSRMKIRIVKKIDFFNIVATEGDSAL